VSTLCNAYCEPDNDTLSSADKTGIIKQNDILKQNDLTTYDSIYKVKKNTSYKVILCLTNHSRIKGKASRFYDSSVLIIIRDSTGNTISKIVNVNDIYTIKIRRKAFWTGMEMGVASGFVAGVLIVAASSKDSSLGSIAVITGLILGIPAAVPGAIIGSVVSSIITKRNFKIEGDEKKFEAMHLRLQKVENFFK